MPENIEEQIIIAANKLGKALIGREMMLLSVESCTGGGVGYYCTSQAGSSKWYAGGHITYSNEQKINLGVPADILEEHGAVSEQTAVEMSRAAIRHAKQASEDSQGVATNYCSLAITGIAGPEGGTKDKPVGTVYFALTTPNYDTIATERCFTGDRYSIRQQSILFVLSEMHLFIG